MKKHICIIVALVFLFSCTNDDSILIYPEDNPDFSSISITSESETLSVDAGNILSFTPNVSQSIEAKSLEYIWTAYLPDNNDYPMTVIGNELSISYSFPAEGVWNLRLEVKNEDYSAFKIWKVSVREQDEGILVVGTDDDGSSCIAFARRLSETDILEGKELTFISNVVANVNPNINLREVIHVSRVPFDYAFSGSALWIFCKDKVYAANPTTFEIFQTLDFRGQFGTSIKKVSSLDSYMSRSSCVFTEDGRVIYLDQAAFYFFESERYNGSNTYDDFYGNLMYTQAYAPYNIFVTYCNNIQVNYTESKLWFYGIDNTDNGTQSNEYEGRNIISVTSFNGSIFGGTNYDYFVIATDKTNPLDVKYVQSKISAYSGFYSEIPYTYTASEPINLEQGSTITPNARYNQMYYFKDNEVFVWTPLNVEPNNQLPNTPSITLDGNKEVTCLGISPNQDQLYVGFYDPDASTELKGGLYIYDCSEFGTGINMQPKQIFEGISKKPVYIFYKQYGKAKFYPDFE